MKNKISTSKGFLVPFKNPVIVWCDKSRDQEQHGLMSHLGAAENPFGIISIDKVG